MSRPREIWFERTGVGSTWKPVHADGRRALVVLFGTLAATLLFAVLASAAGLDPIWFLVTQGICVAVGIWFLFSIRGRVR